MQALRDVGGTGSAGLYTQAMEALGGVELEDAYAIQSALVHLGEGLTSRHVGWKIGATAPGPQAALGLPEPFHGPLFERWLRPVQEGEQVQVRCSELGVGGITVETELGVELGCDLPPGGALDAAAVEAAIRSVAPCIEVTARRLVPPAGAGPAGPVVVADSGGCGLVVVGKRLTLAELASAELSLPGASVSVSKNGDFVGLGTGASVLGSPLNSLSWLARHLVATGDHLRAGDFIITGTMHGKTAVAPGDFVSADFGKALGVLSLRFSA